MDDTLRQLIEMLKNLAPEVWAIYIKQTIIFGFADIATSIFFGLSARFFIRLPLKRKLDDVEQIVGFCLVGLLVLLSFVFAVFGVMYLVNPEYWAIHNMIGQIRQ